MEQVIMIEKPTKKGIPGLFIHLPFVLLVVVNIVVYCLYFSGIQVDVDILMVLPTMLLFFFVYRLLFWNGLYFVLTRSEIRIMAGPLQIRTIRLKDVTVIRPKVKSFYAHRYFPTSDAVLSFTERNGRETAISPVNRDAFLKEILALWPHIEYSTTYR